MDATFIIYIHVEYDITMSMCTYINVYLIYDNVYCMYVYMYIIYSLRYVKL